MNSIQSVYGYCEPLVVNRGICYNVGYMKSLKLNKPHLLVVIGLPGAGKSFFAKKFSKMFGAPHVDHTFYRSLTTGLSASDAIINDTIEKLMLTQQTIVIEGPGHEKRSRKELGLLAHKKGYKVLYIWVQVDPATASARAVNRTKIGVSRQEFDNRLKKFHPPEKNESYLVISGKHTYQTQARTVLKKIVTERPLASQAPLEDEARKAFLRSRLMG